MELKNKLEKMKNAIDSKNLKFPEPLKLDLQFFAEPEPEPEPTPEPEPVKVELTEEELQKKIESESDKKLEKALQTARANWEKEFEKKIEEEKKEAERLAKLSEKERKEEELSKREQDLETRLKELERKELKTDAIADLKDKGLPVELADTLLAENAEKTLENINSLKKSFDEAVNAAVKERLRQDTPPAGGGSSTDKNPFSKEHFNLTEQARIFKDNPELYKKLKAEANN